MSAVPPRPAKRAPAPPATPTRPAIAAGADPFADLLDTRTSHGKFLMFYSEAGMGKTTLAAMFPDPMFIVTSGEQGIFLYKERGLADKNIPVVQLDPLFAHDSIPADTGHPGFLRCLEACRRFRDLKHDRKTLVIDSVSGLQDLCHQHCASKLFGGNIDGNGKDEFLSYYKGYIKSAEAFWSSELLTLLLEIVAKGYNVILLAHNMFKQVDNVGGPEFSQYRPELDKEIWKYTKKDLHGVFFLGQEVQVSIDSKTKKKSAIGDRRFIGLAPSPYYVAKSWCTPDGVGEIDCGANAQETWQNLKTVLGM